MNSVITKYSIFFSLLTFFVSNYFSSNAQITKPETKFYLQGGIGITSRKGVLGELGFHAVLNNKWIATVSYQNIEARPRNLPHDYEGDIFILIPIDLTPTVNFNLFSITTGKMFSSSNNAWISTEGGITFGNGEKVTFTPTDPQFYILGRTSNYNDETERKSIVGVLLRVDFNWAITSYMGMGTNIFLNINSTQSPIGAQLTLLFGKMGKMKRTF